MPFGVRTKTLRIVAATTPMLIASWYMVAATDAPSISGLSRPRFCSAFNIPATAEKLDDRIYRIRIAGKPAGRESMTIWRSGDTTIVTSEVDLKVRLYFVHTEMFRNCRKETWEISGPNKLILSEFRSETNMDDGSENNKIHLIWDHEKRDFTTLSIFDYDLGSKTKYFEPVKYNPEIMADNIKNIIVKFIRIDKLKEFELSLFKITGDIRRYVWYNTKTNKLVRMCGREFLETDIEGWEERIAPILRLMPKCADLEY